MALTNPTTAFAPGFDSSLIDKDDWILSAAARAGSAAAWAMLRGPFRGTPQFYTVAKTTDNSAASSAMDLTSLGLTFAAQAYRRIYFRSTAVSGASTWVQDWEQIVWGNDGTTPKLLGSPKLLNAVGQISGTSVQYGKCRAQATYAGDTATAVSANSTAGSSLGNNATNTVTLTHPIARSSPKYIRGLNASTDTANTPTEHLNVGGYVAGGTSTTILLFLADLATPSADGFDDVGILDVEFFIVPPPSIALVMSSNNVQVHVGYDASDNIYHRIEVWAGRQDAHPLAID